ncbi:unnamed protein product [Amoebophrya sp. A120]|nr:unnamed protein product [Amoebophrya sp. A120]|eukprot:GSA120T00005636001.1
MFSKVDVNGPGALPLFDYLKNQAPGIAGTTNIKWNFTKFLVGRDGLPIDRFFTNVNPLQLERDIVAALQVKTEPTTEIVEGEFI